MHSPVILLKWSGLQMCACASVVGVWREKTLWGSGGEREGGNYKDETRTGEKFSREKKKKKKKKKKMTHTKKKKKKKKKTQIRFTQVPNLLNSYLKRSANLIRVSGRDFVLLWKRCLARSQCNTAKTDQSEQWCLRKSLLMVPSVTCKKDFLESFFFSASALQYRRMLQTDICSNEYKLH